MSDDSKTDDDSSQRQRITSDSVREDLVNKAVDFLLHPKVADTSVKQKMQFLQDKKGLTPDEVVIALKRAGIQLSDSHQEQPKQRMVETELFRPFPVTNAAPTAEWGVGAVLLTAGLAAVVGGTLVWMGNQWINAVWGTDEEDDVAPSPARGTPASAKKRRKKKKKKKQQEEVSELKDAFTAAFEEQASQNSEMFASVKTILDQVTENNKIRMESLRTTSSSGSMSDETVKNDVQTIKQMLMTQQLSRQVSVPETSSGSSVVASTVGEGIVDSIPKNPALPAFMQEAQPPPVVSAGEGIVDSIPKNPALPAFMQEAQPPPVVSAGIEIPSKPALPSFQQEISSAQPKISSAQPKISSAHVAETGNDKQKEEEMVATDSQ